MPQALWTHASTTRAVDALNLRNVQYSVVNLNLVDRALEWPVHIALLSDGEP